MTNQVDLERAFGEATKRIKDAEIERLRADIEEWKSHHQAACLSVIVAEAVHTRWKVLRGEEIAITTKRINEQNAEIERLRGELVRATSGPRDDEEIDRLRAENAKLRAALELARDALYRDNGNYSFVLQAIADALANEETK